MEEAADPYLPYDGGGDDIPLRELHKRGMISLFLLPRCEKWRSSHGCVWEDDPRLCVMYGSGHGTDRRYKGHRFTQIPPPPPL